MTIQLFPKFAIEQVKVATTKSGANMMYFISNNNMVEEDYNLIYKTFGIAEYWESTKYCSMLSVVQRKVSLAKR